MFKNKKDIFIACSDQIYLIAMVAFLKREIFMKHYAGFTTLRIHD